MKERFFFILLCMVGLSHTLWSQGPVAKNVEEVSSSVAKNYDKGVSYLRNMDLEKAEKFLIKTLEKEPGFIDANREIGLLYYRQKRYSDALKYLEFASMHDPDWTNSLIFTLASTYWHLDRFNDCETTLEGLFANPVIGEKLKKEATKMLQDARYSSQKVDFSDQIHMEKLSPAINTEWPEYLPVITADGQSLVFTRRLRGREDFYASRQDTAGQWGYARAITELNTAGNEGAMCLSADGKTMIYAICDDPRGFGSCDLYQSINIRGRWSPPKNLGSNINSKFKETQASLSPDGRRLFFVSDRPDGIGDHDIWYSDMNPKGEWEPPVNAGKTINTPYDELTPNIHFDGVTLYFASAGHPGLGGLDMFKSIKNKDGEWETPVNLGYPINSKLDQSCLAVHIDGQQAYLSKESKDELGNVTMNIHHFTLPADLRAHNASYVRIQVQDKATDQPLRALIEIISLESNKRQGLYTTDYTGETLICLMNGQKYAANVYHPDYIFMSEQFDMEERPEAYHTQSMTIKLTATPVFAVDTVLSTEPIVLKNVFFDTGSASLSESSFYELNKLVSWLQSNEGIRIEISGHTDNVGNPDSNQKLSEQRALTVVQYLTSQGIDAARLSHRGYGDTRPVANNDTESGRKQNRRTAFRIIR